MNPSVNLIGKYTMSVFVIILIELVYLNVAIPVNNVLPCNFQDSINITEGIPGPDDTIIFNNLTFQRNQYANINYFEQKGPLHVEVSSHLRGCPCQIRPCIRLCCPFGKISNPSLKKTFGEAYKCQKNEMAKKLNHEIFDQNNNESTKVDLSEIFSFVSPTFPRKSYIASEYQILENGQILEGNQTFSHQDYCLRATINKETNEVRLIAVISYDEVDPINGKDILYAIAMLISVPFIAATFLVYMFLPELRNLHGKCFLCYLASLMIGYSLMAWLKFNGWHSVEPIRCKLIGHLTYFSLLSAFIWSNVISFDLHRSFRTSRFLRSFSENKRFLVYMAYWVIPLLITFIIILLDQLKPFSDELLPGLATKTCFLKHAKNGKLSPFLYFYMIICIIYTVNIIYFVLTALKIHAAQRDIIKITSQEESSRHQSHLNNERDNLILYMRLFIIMGATWIMEGITFLTADPNNNDYNTFVVIVDLWNMLQGLIIFILFVLKRRVMKLIMKRFHILFGKSDEIGNGSMKTKGSTTDSRYSCDKSKYKEIN